jgi:hypothetical protein
MRRSLTLAAAVLGVGFAGAAVDTTAKAAPAKEVVSLRRLTEQEYRNSIADIFGSNIVVEGAFEPGTRVGGLLATSTSVLSVTSVGFGSDAEMADSIASQVVSAKNRGKLLACTPASPTAPDDACAAQIFSHYGLLLFRRPLTSSELKQRVDLANKLTKASNDFYAGLRYGFDTLLESSDFLFRKEIAVSTDGKTYTLDAYSRASRLSFMMWNTTPSAALLQLAESGELNTPPGVAKQVDLLLASPKLDAGMSAFFSDMLELDTFDNTTKDTLIYPDWIAPITVSAREETLRSTIDLTLHANGDLRDLVTTRKTFINRTLAPIYGTAFNFHSDWVPYEFPADSGRSGLLTQVSMLTMFSHPGRSSPTERGVALMDILMCEPTPTPPANVDFSIVNNTDGPLKTVRERLLAHATNPTCASCHTHSDPMGLSLEDFDSTGVHRTKENGSLIDVSANIQGKTFVGAAGLGQYLHDNPKFPACVARKLSAYATGANSQDVDPSSFKAAYKAFVDSGYRLKVLLKGLVTEPDFFSAPPPVQQASVATSTELAKNRN